VGFLHRRRWLTPYLLLAPGLVWLAIFFVVPLGFLAYQSLEEGDAFGFGYRFAWAWHNFSDAISTYHPQLVRSFEYAGIATAVALLLSYPLAYWIAFRGGRWKNLLLLFIIAPFFVTYLIRTLAWETILSDDGVVVSVIRHLHLLGVLGDGGHVLASPTAVVAGITYNFLPFMALPLYVSLEQVDPRLIGGPLREQAARVPAGDAAALPARRDRGHAPDLHPRGRRLHQRPAPGDAAPVHDRQRHPVAVPRDHRLPDGGVALVHPDGADPGRHRRLRPCPRDGEADRMSVAAERLPAKPGPGVLARVWRVARRQILTVYALLAFAYLLVPIAIVVLFSFNDPAGRFNYTWQGFTLDNWRNWDAVPGMRSAIELSLEIAAVSSICATLLGTLIALALVRYGFRGRAATNLLVFLPMSSPEIVLGASLLTLFLTMSGIFTLGFWTIFIAHVMFCISYVVVTVKARLIGFDRHLEEAAMDLGANELVTFARVTLPLIAPAILAGTLLSFALSIDDFVITNFVAGSDVTFPLFVWGAARVGAPPQVNVIGTAIFAVAVLAMLANVLVQMRRSKGAR
jgi:spermidine/putrescine transport system permease protein